MGIKKKLLKGGASLALGHAFSNALSFSRNVIIARLLSPSDYGIAAIFTLTITFLEMLSNLSAETLLVQAEFGDKEDFQSTVHLFQLIRGFLVAIIIAAAAPLVSNLFSIPEATWAFAALALVPFMRSFVHRDFDRLQRHYIYYPQISTEVIAGIISTSIAVPLCLTLRNYTAALWVLVLHSFTFVAVSHVVAKRKFRIKPKLDYGKEIFRFGWPLLINGILMFVIFQGDRLVIGSAKKIFGHQGYTLNMLGWYSAAFTLTLTPSLVIARVCQALLLPALSEVKGDIARLERRYRLSVQSVSLAIGTFGIPFAMGGGHLIQIVFGQKYEAAASVIGLLGLMQAFRLFRIVPTIAAMAQGDTQNAMIANVARVTMFGGILVCAYLRLDLVWYAGVGMIGEGISTTVSIFRLNRVHNYSIVDSIYAPCLATVFMFGSYYISKYFDFPLVAFSTFSVVLLAFLTVYVIVMLWFLEPLRVEVIHTFKGGP